VISVRIKAALVTYQRYYFADRPQSKAAAGLAEFMCSRFLEGLPLFKRHAEYTKLIELQLPGRQLLDTLPEQCRYEIRRAERDGVSCTSDVDFSEHFAFHTEFCSTRNRPTPSWAFFDAHRKHLLITKAMLGRDTLCMHAYLVDPQASRGRLFVSSSLFRQQSDRAVRAQIGRANRYLHYWDMQEMAARGLRIYDLGGYALGTTDPSLAGINDFKDSFGGALVHESTFVSLPLALSRQAASLTRLARGRLRPSDGAISGLTPEHDRKK
jgi:hypothetical protein